jgi:hypothetical protein
MKIDLVGAELLHADGQTDRLTKQVVAYSNFAKATKNLRYRNIVEDLYLYHEG